MPHPNILLIVLDSARADRFSCYGYEKPTTPNIDLIAEQGTLFEQCWSESNWTLPVSYTLLTGLAPREHGAEAYRDLPEGMPTLPQLLQESRWRTTLCSANAYLGTGTGLHEAFDHFETSTFDNPLLHVPLKYVVLRLGLTDKGGADLNRHALRHMTEAGDDPWLTVVWSNECHYPWVAKGEFASRFVDMPMPLSRRWSLTARARRLQQFVTAASNRDLQDLNGLYDGGIGYADHLVGQLRSRMEALGRWQDTVVIITSDHGDMIAEHGLGGHGRDVKLHRQICRVPLIVCGPDYPAGERTDAIVQLADITQTIGEMTGVLDRLPPTAAERVDLRNAAVGNGRDQAIIERGKWPKKRMGAARKKYGSYDCTPLVGEVRSCFSAGWHLIDAQTAETELYDTNADPDETRNLIEEQPDRARELFDILAHWREKATPHPATEGLVEREDPRVEARLRGMGYF